MGRGAACGRGGAVAARMRQLHALLHVQAVEAVRRKEAVCALRLPHGGGKHGRNATEADKGRWHAMAARVPGTQHAGTHLRHCSKGSAVQAGERGGVRAGHGREENWRKLCLARFFSTGRCGIAGTNGALACASGRSLCTDRKCPLWVTSQPLRARAAAGAVSSLCNSAPLAAAAHSTWHLRPARCMCVSRFPRFQRVAASPVASMRRVCRRQPALTARCCAHRTCQATNLHLF